MLDINYSSPTSMEYLCRYCLTAAIDKTWPDEIQDVTIDTVIDLTGNYRVIMTKIFSALNLTYPPDIAWFLIFDYLKNIEHSLT